MTVSKNDWVWYGFACHFAGGSKCRYHMGTRIGGYLISTVGAYYPTGQNNERKTLSAGADSFFETMVFVCPGETSDGDPIHSGSEIDTTRYKKSIDAEHGHRRICDEYAAKEQS